MARLILDTGVVVRAVRGRVDLATHHAALLAHVRRTGRPRGALDLIIAAAARATSRILVSTDRQAGFDELPEVRLRLIPTALGGVTASGGP